MDVTKSSSASAVGDGTSEGEDKNAYTVGWICALPLEMAAAKLMLDEVHKAQVEQDEADHNTYILGVIQGHKVVIACLPKGVYGTITAATVAKDMLRTFKSIRFGLMVGVGGGAPSSTHDIRLGDVVVSVPTDVNGGVIQYDRGKTGKDEEFKRTGSLNAPPTVLLTAVGSVETNHSLGESDIPQFLADAAAKIPKQKIRQKYVYQGEENDCLFHSEYEHVNLDAGCDDCDAAQTVQREERDDTDPVVHYGNIASGNQVIKHAETRDRLSKELGVLCFEMEAAGLMQEFPCLVVRGICDYSDSHKNKRWQEYAAATAAAYAKELLSVVTPKRVEKEKPILLDPQLCNLVLETKEAIIQQTEKQESHHRSAKDQECLNDLFQTEPADDRKRILLDKGGLLEGSCQWLLDLPEYQNWKMIPHGSRLWIKGDPGKGKTMLICGIIESLEIDPLGGMCYYFFCQATDSRLNTATAILRGLLHPLARRHPWILSKVRDRYDIVGKMLFEDANAWHALSEILLSSFHDSRARGITLVIDALDECVTDRRRLLDFIQAASTSPVRWLVSSRNFPDIREALASKSPETEFSISLERQQDIISSIIQIYIKKKVEDLATRKRYDDSTRSKVERHLWDNANNTFLWVALVCKTLRDSDDWEVELILDDLPEGLTALYRGMLHYVPTSNKGKLYRKILAILSILKRPVALRELPFITELPSHISQNMRFLEKLLEDCGSFLIVRDGIVRFVHQSAVDFLQDERYEQSEQLEGLSGVADRHQSVFQYSLSVLSQSETLKRNIYGLEEPGSCLEDVTPPKPDQLACLKYSCVHWVDHLHASMIAPKKKRSLTVSSGLEGDTIIDDPKIILKIHRFLQIKFLYWVEALILLGHVSKGIQAIQNLATLIEPDFNENARILSDFIRDANRFVLYNRNVMEKYPLQLYASSLAFSPEDSVVRNHFGHDIPHWIVKISGLESTWNACVQTIDSDMGELSSVAFSNDGKWFACMAASPSHASVAIFEADTGILAHRLDRDVAGLASISFPRYNEKTAQLAMAFGDGTIEIWDAKLGILLRILRENFDCPDSPAMKVLSVAVSFDGYKIASAHADGNVVIWDAESGDRIHALPGHEAKYWSPLAFSPDNSLVAAISDTNTINVWNVQAPRSPQLLVNADWISNLTFSADSRLFAFADCRDRCIEIWDISTSSLRKKIPIDSLERIYLAFSPKAENRQLAWAQGSKINIWDMDTDMSVWNMDTGMSVENMDTNMSERMYVILLEEWLNISALVFSPDGQRLASGTGDGIKMWDISIPPSESNDLPSHAKLKLASSSDDGHAVYYYDGRDRIGIRNINTGWQDILISEAGSVVAISKDGKRLACATFNKIKIHDTTTGAILQMILSPSEDKFYALAFRNNHEIASMSPEGIRLWDISTADCICIYDTSIYWGYDSDLTISQDGNWLAYQDYEVVPIWDVRAAVTSLSLKVGFMEFPKETHITFSSNNTTLVLWDLSVIEVWDTRSGSLLWKLDLPNEGYCFGGISFDTNISTRLHTAHGFLDLDSESLGDPGQEAPSIKGLLSGYGIHPRMTGLFYREENWLMKNEQKVLWIPWDYQFSTWSEDEEPQLTVFINGKILIWVSPRRNKLMRLELKDP